MLIGWLAVTLAGSLIHYLEDWFMGRSVYLSALARDG